MDDIGPRLSNNSRSWPSPAPPPLPPTPLFFQTKHRSAHELNINDMGLSVQGPPLKWQYSAHRSAYTSRSTVNRCWDFIHPKSITNFRAITWNVEENKILHEIFRKVESRLPRYISFYFGENQLSFGQCTSVQATWRQIGRAGHPRQLSRQSDTVSTKCRLSHYR